MLPADSIRAHYFAGVKATASESDRLYALAREKFESALAFAPDDTEIISRYAQSVINYLELESIQVRPKTIGCQRTILCSTCVGHGIC